VWAKRLSSISNESESYSQPTTYVYVGIPLYACFEIEDAFDEIVSSSSP